MYWIDLKRGQFSFMHAHLLIILNFFECIEDFKPRVIFHKPHCCVKLIEKNEKCLVRMLLSQTNPMPMMAKCTWRSVTVMAITASLAQFGSKYGFQRKFTRFQSKPFLCDFCCAAKTMSEPSKSDVSQKFFSWGHFNRKLLNKMDSQTMWGFLVSLKSPERMSIGRWLILHKKQGMLSSRHQRVSQTTDSENESENC